LSTPGKTSRLRVFAKSPTWIAAPPAPAFESPNSAGKRGHRGKIPTFILLRSWRRQPRNEMSVIGVLAVFSGAGFGALLRWWLGLNLNPVFPTVPLGTLAANLLGGLLVGAATAFFANSTALAPEWRLLAITGFLGGLTTFSTFSAEVVTLVGRNEYLWALATASVHLFGSLLLTGLGILLSNALFVRA
jgi:CrcB protein